MALLLSTLLALVGCGTSQRTEVPPDGWANRAPTRVVRAVDRDDVQLLEVAQGELKTWISVPDVDAQPGDYVLLGQGTPRAKVAIPELGTTAEQVVDIPHVQVVDEATARSTIVGKPPADAVPIQTVYAELEARADREIVVYGTVVKAPSAVGSVWVHLQDGTGSAEAGTNDLTVKASQPVTVGRRVGFRGTLRRDVDLGFGYRYDALVEDAVLLD